MLRRPTARVLQDERSQARSDDPRGGVSAANLLSNRPGGQQMSTALTSRDATHVVSSKLDRLFQDVVDALN